MSEHLVPDRRWLDMRRRLCEVVARQGVDDVAEAIPAGKSTVYRMIRGEVNRPSLAIFRGVERVLADAERGIESATWE